MYFGHIYKSVTAPNIITEFWPLNEKELFLFLLPFIQLQIVPLSYYMYHKRPGVSKLILDNFKNSLFLSKPFKKIIIRLYKISS